MNKKNTEYLFNTFPEFFKNRDDMHKSLMWFGFECGDGWFNLIKELCENIKKWFETHESRHYYDDNYEKYEVKKGIQPSFSVQQVKEKFGGLRFYIGSAPQAIHDIIHIAEQNSYYICEHCGDDIRNRVYNDGKYHGYYRDMLPWVLTLCDSCLKKHLEEKNMPFGDYISDWQRERNNPYMEG